MSKTLKQSTPEFLELGSTAFAEGDSIVFTSGLVDIHSHGRDNNEVLGDGMTDILAHSAKQFGLVLLMPNLAKEDALLTPQKSVDYYWKARQATSTDMKILSTVYLNKDLKRQDVKFIADNPHIAGIKSYPAHGTTGAEHGLRSPLDAPKQLEWMQEYGVPLLVHGQVRTSMSGLVLDEWDREPCFYGEVAPQLDYRYPELPISYEHLSTGIGAEAVITRKGKTQGTFTILHLGYTRTDVMDTGVRTDMVMKPMVQHAVEKPKLWKALGKHPDRFALGSDDAWHPTTAKHSKNCACGGCYGPYRVGYYLDVFEKALALELFGRFACVNAAQFYGVEVPKKTLVMRKEKFKVEQTLRFGKHLAEPLHAGEEITGWNLVS